MEPEAAEVHAHEPGNCLNCGAAWRTLFLLVFALASSLIFLLLLLALGLLG